MLTSILQARNPRPNGLVVAGGQLLTLPTPLNVRQTRAYFKRGVGLAMRHTQHCADGLRQLADEFERDWGEAQVQIFATPSNTHGFAWHYDDEDVFIAQIAGKKDYYLRPNTVATHVPAASAVFSRFKQEPSQLQAATLIAGDFLYIPARWWHMAICHEDALSLSVGVFPRGLDEADAL